MKLFSKKQNSLSTGDYEFSDVEEFKSFGNNAIDESDSTKRKTVSPVQSDRLKKSKSIQSYF